MERKVDRDFEIQHQVRLAAAGTAAPEFAAKLGRRAGGR
jgi:hypothetical protein